MTDSGSGTQTESSPPSSTGTYNNSSYLLMYHVIQLTRLEPTMGLKVEPCSSRYNIQLHTTEYCNTHTFECLIVACSYLMGKMSPIRIAQPFKVPSNGLHARALHPYTSCLNVCKLGTDCRHNTRNLATNYVQQPFQRIMDVPVLPATHPCPQPSSTWSFPSPLPASASSHGQALLHIQQSCNMIANR